MKQWINQHTQAIRLVFSHMRHNTLSTLMICCVMGVALCLPGILYVIVAQLNQLAGDVQSEPQISLFLKLDITPDGISKLDKLLSNQPDIQSHRFVSKDSAWQKLQLSAGAAAGNLEKNPLPDAYFVTPKALDPAAVERLQSQMQQWPGVELAQADASWIKRLYALVGLGKKAILALATLLGFALVAITGNTIRLQILTQREEIEVSKLIGATDRFIRRPFLYAGAIYGLGAGLAAWLLLAGVISLFNVSIADIAALYSSNFRLDLPDFTLIGAMIASAVGLGWIGSFVVVNRSLWQFDHG